MLYRLSPITDQHKISPCNIYAYSTPAQTGSILPLRKRHGPVSFFRPKTQGVVYFLGLLSYYR